MCRMRVYINGETLMTFSGETGEITPLTLSAGDVVTKKGTDRPAERDVNRGRHFKKVYDSLSDAAAELTGAGLYLLALILPFLSTDGSLCTGNGRVVTRQYLCARAAKAGRSERSVDRGIAELSRAGILARGERGGRAAFYVNPRMMQNGTRAGEYLLGLFGDG